MSKTNYLIISIVFLLVTTTGQIKLKSSNLKSTTQQIDCGIFYITENENINTIVNLNDCLMNKLYTNILLNIENNQTNESSYSFETRFGYKSNEIVFYKYFQFNRHNGQIDLKQNIDRESFCNEQQHERESSSSLYFKPGHKNFLNNKLTDYIDCNCNSLTCEMRLVFVVFSNKQMAKSGGNKFKKFSNANFPKYIYLTVIVQDSNDNKPKFLRNFLQFNLTESLNNKRNTQFDLVDFDSNSRDMKCKISQFNKQITNISIDEEDVIDQQELKHSNILLSDNLIQLETAIDLDVGVNSKIKYKLFLFKNTIEIDSILNEKEKSIQLEMINKLIQNDYLDNCQNKFELIETDSNYKLTENSFDNKFDQPNADYLFFKVNTFLDREIQDIYHFILIASNGEESTLNDLDEQNYLIIRLNINDLNDNQPLFTQKKYVYHLNETTELSEYYSPIKYEDYYQELLRQTCNQLKSTLSVKAIDYDYGENGIVKYKIVQQIHRKSSQDKSKYSNNEKENKAIFHIDENSGKVTLHACKNIDFELGLTKEKFIEITQYLDYELYLKHILVIEASDSNLHNPLQSLATLEINLLDLNDNPPMINSIHLSYSNNPNQIIENFYDHLSIYQLNESISNYTTEIIIDGLSEFLKSSTSIGQLVIVDLDSLNANKKIDLNIWELDENKQKIVRDSKLILKNTKTVEIGLKKQNKFLHKSKTYRNLEHNLENLINEKLYHTIEMYDIYLNFDLDAENKQTHEYIIEINDNGELKSFKTWVHLILNVKDENDNLPFFEKQSYTFRMINNTKQTCFGKVKAVDLDIDPANSFITYEINEINYENNTNQTITITSNRNNEKFYISNESNQLCTLDDDIEFKKYHLSIKAFNKNATRNQYMHSEALVELVINDQSALTTTKLMNNRKIPVFFKKKYTFHVTEHDANLVNSDLITSPNHKLNMTNDEIQFIGNVNVFDTYCDSSSKLMKYYIIDNERNYLELNMDNQRNPWLISDEISEENFKSDYKSFTTKMFYRTKLYKKSINQTNPKYRSLKMIENIYDFIHVNSSNGNIYLLKKIDREEITKIKFHLYVSDCEGNAVDHSSNGNYSVPVVIEIVDINDSKPQCKGSPYLISTNENLSKFSKPLEIYSVMLDTKSMNQNVLFQIYKFDCFDLDINKNGELTFEIEKIIFKSLMSKKSGPSNPSVNNFNNINTSVDEELINEIVTTKIHKRSKSRTRDSSDFQVNLFKDYLLDLDLFSLDRNKGILSINLSEKFLSYFNDLDVDIHYHIQKFFKKSFFIVQIKVSDRGMIPLSSYYYFQIYFCINMKHNSYEKYLKHKTYYCDFDSTHDDRLNNNVDNNNNHHHQIKIKSLVNSLIENNHFGDIIINESKLVKQTFVYNNKKNPIIIAPIITTTNSIFQSSTKQSAKKSNKYSTTNLNNQKFVTTITRNNNNDNPNTINKNFLIYTNKKQQSTLTTSMNKGLKSSSSSSSSTSKNKPNNENEDYDYSNNNNGIKSKLISTSIILNCYLIIYIIII